MEEQIKMGDTLLDNSVSRIIKLKERFEPNRLVGSTTGKFVGPKLDLHANIIKFDKDLCEYILENHNTKNRPTTSSNVLTLSGEMVSGMWRFDGQPIRFDNEGNLIDGQHRLLAIIRANKTHEGFYLHLLVLTGLSNESFLVMDTGRKRTSSDTLATIGVEYYKTAATATKFIDAFKKGKYGVNKTTLNGALSNFELPKYYDKLNKTEVKISNCLKFGEKLYSSSTSNLLTKSDIAAYNYLFGERNIEESNKFLQQVVLGIGLTPNSPALLIRDRLIRKKTDKTYNFSGKDRVQAMVYCWNKFRNNQEIKLLRVPENYEPIIL